MIFVDCKLTVYYRIFQLDTVNSSPGAIWCGFEYSCENLWVPFTDPGHFTYGITRGTGWKCIYISLSSFTTPNQQLIISCRYVRPVASCMIGFLSTRKEWKVFFCPTLCFKISQATNQNNVCKLSFHTKNKNEKYIIHHEIQDSMISL